MKRHHSILLLLVTLSAVQLAADTITLQTGQRVKGTFVGGNARQIDFLTTSGESLRIPIDKVQSVAFPPATAAAPVHTPPRTGVLIPGGTTFRVRTIDPIDVDVTQAGMTFRGALDDPIMSGGAVIVPRGADVTLVAAKVQQGGKMKGSDLIELKVNTIHANGRAYPVVTSVTQDKSAGEGKKTTRKVVGGAGLGALIGGIAGGGKGAGIGALAGAATGTIVAASGEPHLKIPSETRLQFQLLSDWKL